MKNLQCFINKLALSVDYHNDKNFKLFEKYNKY